MLINPARKQKSVINFKFSNDAKFENPPEFHKQNVIGIPLRYFRKRFERSMFYIQPPTLGNQVTIS